MKTVLISIVFFLFSVGVNAQFLTVSPVFSSSDVATWKNALGYSIGYDHDIRRFSLQGKYLFAYKGQNGYADNWGYDNFKYAEGTFSIHSIQLATGYKFLENGHFNLQVGFDVSENFIAINELTYLLGKNNEGDFELREFNTDLSLNWRFGYGASFMMETREAFHPRLGFYSKLSVQRIVGYDKTNSGQFIPFYFHTVYISLGIKYRLGNIKSSVPC